MEAFVTADQLPQARPSRDRRMERELFTHSLQLQHPASHQQNNPNQTCLTDNMGTYRQIKPSNSPALKEAL